MDTTGSRQHLVGHNDQTVAGEQSQGLAVLLVHSDVAAAYVCVVKARHIVVNQGGAMHDFNRHRCCVGQRWCIVATSLCNGQAQLRAYASTAWKHRMTHG
jgi:hypothetical protein